MVTNLNELVLKAIEGYNRYRSPEATAKFVGVEKDGFIVEFSGAFCLSCGIRDYFEDFIYELEDLNKNVKAEIKESEQTGPQRCKVHYVVEGSFSGAELDEQPLFRDFLMENDLSFKDYLASNACTKDMIKFHFRTWLFERKTKQK